MHLIPSAIAPTPSLHLARSVSSSTLNPIFSIFSSTCFFHVCFGRPRFCGPFTSNIIAFFKMLSSSLLTTCPYHLTPFALAILSKVSFRPSIFISLLFRTDSLLLIRSKTSITEFTIVLYRFKNLLTQFVVAFSQLKNLIAQFAVALLNFWFWLRNLLLRSFTSKNRLRIFHCA